MSNFKAKIHQIIFWLWLRPRLRWGADCATQTPYLDLRG